MFKAKRIAIRIDALDQKQFMSGDTVKDPKQAPKGQPTAIQVALKPNPIFMKKNGIQQTLFAP